jgi:ATP-binding cassette subfamily C (CFTR/MRP) protein 1
MDEYGNAKDNRKERSTDLAKNETKPLQYKPDSAEDVLMELEERNVGAVPWDVYKKYLRFSGGLIWAPVILVLLIFSQANQGLSRISFDMFTLTTVLVATSMFLGFWTGNTLPGFTQGGYMGVYAALGTNFSFLIYLLTNAFN